MPVYMLHGIVVLVRIQLGCGDMTEARIPFTASAFLQKVDQHAHLPDQMAVNMQQHAPVEKGVRIYIMSPRPS